ncbi:LysE family translocator [Sphingobium sufflavum]|uniref:LysE family translocator n=1 Tax=Sphingobium sufflavum TaxID=1129547 RepID=UPI001F3A5112|nr:LysE family translocator [Sphingobium sufflavum]MCE7797164.1 LysE family translocator [Sphingobium sufflavum]
MEPQALLALTSFGVVSSFTPGPNNLMLMASGANFGIVRSLPHMAGVVVGFFFMLLIVGLGLFGLFHAWPPSFTILKVVSVAYTLWLAWKIARADAPGAENIKGRPMSFLQASAFQWVNPKAWTMALSAITLYAPDEHFASILLISLVFALIGIASTGSWMLAGLSIRGWLSSRRRLLAFNYGMAALLVGSIAMAL